MMPKTPARHLPFAPTRTAMPTAALGLAALLLAAGCGNSDSGPKGGAGGTTSVDRTGGRGGSGSGTGGATGSGSGGSGTAGAGGSSLAGGAGGTGSGAGGSGLGGAGGGATDAGPAASFDPPADKAVGKFCNQLVGENMMILEFALEVGAQPARMVARSGECFPPAGQPCTALPIGAAAVKLVDMADGMLVAEGQLMIPGGSQMLFLTDLDDATGQPVLSGGRIRSDANCATIAPAPAGPPPDGGADMGATPRPPLRP
jgi:hypothetical protein